ncbi:ABC transporter permease [Dermatobacter hominis]|uniref:ABC transporter permease n=1 Tax=Dermatobacter hominis TaxID=2884263 RepID=UPI001D12C36B|nr:iron ABC transporter permease [Dermatobacter hominis]UDY36101.1 iron ABC transporter permease [Dermatobacter hominis]
MRPTSLAAPRSASVIALAATALAVVPLVYLALQIGDAGWDHVAEILFRADVAQLAIRSLGLSLSVGVLAGAVGTTTAWLVERSDLPHHAIWHVVVVMPLAVPSYVAAYSWVSWWPATASFWGAVAVLTFSTVPIIHLYVSAIFRGLDGTQEEVARSLGKGPREVFLRLTLPQARRGIAAGVLLASLYVLADFGAVAIMRVPVFTWVILGAYRAGFDPSRAAVLAGALVVLSTVFVLGEALVRGRSAAASVSTGVVRAPTRVSLGRWRWAAVAALTSLAAASVGFPVASYAYWWSTGVSEVAVSEFVGALTTTLLLGAVVAAATVAVAVPLAWLIARFRTRLGVGAERAVMLAHSLPGIVVALSFVYVGVRVLQPIYQRWPIVVLALMALTLSLAIGGLRAAFEQQPQALTDVGRACGRSRTWVFVRVTMPAVLPAIAATAAVIALTSAKELPTVLLLRPAGSDTLSTRLWVWAGVSDSASVAPYALTLVLFSIFPAVIAARIGGGRADRRDVV